MAKRFNQLCHLCSEREVCQKRTCHDGVFIIACEITAPEVGSLLHRQSRDRPEIIDGYLPLMFELFDGIYTPVPL